MKTYKREVAFLTAVIFYLFFGYTLYTLAVAGMHDAMVQFVSVLVMPTFGVLVAAFGIDAFFKGKQALTELEQNNQNSKEQNTNSN